MQTNIEILQDSKSREPINFEETKQYIRAYNQQDEYFIKKNLIPSVRSFFENACNLSFVEKSIRMTAIDINHFDELFFRFTPVNQITLISTEEDGDRTSELINDSDYVDSEAIYNLKSKKLVVEYTTKPFESNDIYIAMLNLASHWYTTRDMSDLPKSVTNIIMMHTKNVFI